jgi:hypothetical protein
VRHTVKSSFYHFLFLLSCNSGVVHCLDVDRALLPRPARKHSTPTIDVLSGVLGRGTRLGKTDERYVNFIWELLFISLNLKMKLGKPNWH